MSYKSKLKYILLKIVIVLFIFLTSFYLFYHQSISDGEFFRADLPVHIETSVSGKGYSFLHRIFEFLYNITGNTVLIAFFLACLMVFTLFVTAILLKCILEMDNTKMSFWGILLISSSFLFISSIYIPRYFAVFYRAPNYGVVCTQPWHNSTYFAMRLFATIVMTVFISIDSHYLNGINLREWIIFVIALTLVNSVKANFLLLLRLLCSAF